jgi:hypothetical protein
MLGMRAMRGDTVELAPFGDNAIPRAGTGPEVALAPADAALDPT